MKFGNNNKDIIKRMTNSSIRSNKTRNMFVVLAIVLTTFMISSVFSIGASFVKNYQVMNTRLAETTATTILNYPKESQIKEIENLGITTSIGKEITVGKVIDKQLDKDKLKIVLKYYDEENWEKQITPAISDIEGIYPTKSNEIMASQKALEFLGKKNTKIGDNIKLKYKDANGNTLEKEFTLSGTYKTYSFFEDTGFLVVSDKYIKNNNLNVGDNGFLTFTLKNKYKYEAIDILKSEVHLNKHQEFTFNYDANNDSSEVAMITVGTIGMIGLFIVFSGYLLIYNIMYIAVTKDINFYGLIKTIGTSPKQIKKIVKGQALRLSLIGIPIGLALGAIVSFGIVPMAMSTFSSGAYSTAMPSDISFNPIIFIGAALFSLLTVNLSCRKPAKIASSISPMEALRYSGTKQSKKNKKRKSTKGGKLYKMAWYNVFRDKKRATLVFLSLFMGCITFLSVNTFIKSLSVENYIDRYVNNDFEIQNIQVAQDKIDNDLISQIKKMDGVESVSKINLGKLQLDYNEKLLLPALKGGYERFAPGDEEGLNKLLEDIEKDPSRLSPNIIGIDDEIIERYNEKTKDKIDVDAFKEGKLALVNNFYYNEEDRNISGEKITLRNKDNDSMTFNTKLFSDEVHLLADVPDNELGIPSMFISQYALEKLDKNYIGYLLYINIDEKYDEAVKSKLMKISDTRGLYMDSKTTQTKEFNNTSMVMNILGGGMAIILIFIGLLNFINVMITGVNVRLKELAVMESIGMTKKQIKKMLTLEGLYYGGITTLLISTLGVGIIYVISELTKKIADYAVFVFPTVPLLSMITLIFVVCLITPSLVYKFSSKRSVTERLREIEK